MSERKPHKLWQLMGFMALLVFAHTSFSQSSSTGDEVQASVLAEAEAALEGAGEEEAQESDSTQTQDEEEDGSGRFIPTEQLSQDLGASFPVDI